MPKELRRQKMIYVETTENPTEGYIDLPSVEIWE